MSTGDEIGRARGVDQATTGGVRGTAAANESGACVARPDPNPAPYPLAPGAGTKRVCIVTGAGGQLGTMFCRMYAEEYDIVAVYRSMRPWLAAQDARFVDPLSPGMDLVDNKHRVFAVQADLTEEGACERVVETALARFDRIDLLVNNAVSSTWAPMLGSDQLARTGYLQFLTNVLVPFYLSTVVAKMFWQGRDDENRRMGRNIVNVSSIAGLRIYPGSGQSMYAASKAALNQLTGHMALEFGAIGIRVNATAANSFPTIVSTERAAAAIRTLDRGRENGAILVVDGPEDRIVRMRPYEPSLLERP